MSNLRRLLWRYEAGLLRREVIEQRLNECLSQVAGSFRESEPGWHEIAQPGRREFKIRVEIDQALSDARAELTAGQFRACAGCIRDAEVSLRRLTAAVDAWRRYDGAKKAVAQAAVPIPLGLIPLFPAIEIATRLLEKAAALLESGDYVATRVVTAMCRREIDTLVAELASEAQSGDFSERIVLLEALGSKLVSLAADSSAVSTLAKDLGNVRALMAEGRTVLAQRVLQSLERDTMNAVLDCEIQRVAAWVQSTGFAAARSETSMEDKNK